MSNRAIRRAAERQAKKAAEKQNKLTSQSAAAANPVLPAASASPSYAGVLEEDDDDLALSPELLAIVERIDPGYSETLARNAAELAQIEAILDQRNTNDSAEPNQPSAPRTAPTAAQIAANRANARLSTGPVSPQGKAAVSQNRRTHGLAGKFTLLPGEDRQDLDALIQSVQAEYQPQSDTEHRLADSLVQHFWRMQRAIHLQEELLLQSEDPTEVDDKRLTLFMRYQTTHERSYYKAQRELINLKKQKRKDENGFESQKRKTEAHEARINLTQARIEALKAKPTSRAKPNPAQSPAESDQSETVPTNSPEPQETRLRAATE